MVKNLYGVRNKKVEVLEVCVETDEEYVVIFTSDEGKKKVCSVDKDKVVMDSGSFKEVSARLCWYSEFYYASPVFFSEELAHDYISALNKYESIWNLQKKIEDEEEKLKMIENSKKHVLDELKLDKEMLLRLSESMC